MGSGRSKGLNPFSLCSSLIVLLSFSVDEYLDRWQQIAVKKVVVDYHVIDLERT